MSDKNPESADSSGRSRVPRRGDRQGGRRHRDNSSFGERQGRRYDAAAGDAGDARGSGKRNPRGGAGERSGAGRDVSRGHSRSRPGQSRGSLPTRGERGERRRERPEPTRREERPEIPEDVTASELDPDIRRDLRGLDKANADVVARHLVSAMYLIDDDPSLALEHGRAAKARAGRIGVVRETVGVLAYRAGEWSEALGELRAARRISGGPGLLALMADCERGMGRPERAIEVARSEESQLLEGADLHELRIVEAGARMDMGQVDAALVTLVDAGLSAEATGEDAARLDYAYAEILLAAERRSEALVWFRRSVAADPLATDADVRAAELEG